MRVIELEEKEKEVFKVSTTVNEPLVHYNYRGTITAPCCVCITVYVYNALCFTHTHMHTFVALGLFA